MVREASVPIGGTEVDYVSFGRETRPLYEFFMDD